MIIALITCQKYTNTAMLESDMSFTKIGCHTNNWTFATHEVHKVLDLSWIPQALIESLSRRSPGMGDRGHLTDFAETLQV